MDGHKFIGWYYQNGTKYKEADAIENAVKKVLEEGYRTIDIAKPGEPQVKCDEMGSLIAERV